MYYSTCTQEEQCLEHSVGEQVEHRSHIPNTVVELGACDTQRSYHECDLRNGRECKHTLDIALYTCHSRSIKRSERTDYSDYIKSHAVNSINWEHACHKVNTCHNHRGGMDKCRHWRRAFHCIGKPNVQWKHCRLTCATHEDECQCPCHDRTAKERSTSGSRNGCLRIARKRNEVECVGIERQNQNTYQETEVGKTSDDKRLFRRRNGSRQCIIKSDKQIGRHTHKLPEDIHLENVGGEYKPKHREGEQRQESIITLEAFFTVHITKAVKMHHKRYRGNDNKHHCRNRVEKDTNLYHQVFGKLKPSDVEHRQLLAHPVNHLVLTCAEEISESRSIGNYRGNTHRQRTQQPGGLLT